MDTNEDRSLNSQLQIYLQNIEEVNFYNNLYIKIKRNKFQITSLIILILNGALLSILILFSIYFESIKDDLNQLKLEKILNQQRCNESYKFNSPKKHVINKNKTSKNYYFSYKEIKQKTELISVSEDFIRTNRVDTALFYNSHFLVDSLKKWNNLPKVITTVNVGTIIYYRVKSLKEDHKELFIQQYVNELILDSDSVRIHSKHISRIEFMKWNKNNISDNCVKNKYVYCKIE